MENVGVQDMIQKMDSYHSIIEEQALVPSFFDPRCYGSLTTGKRNLAAKKIIPQLKKEDPRRLQTRKREGSSPSSLRRNPPLTLPRGTLSSRGTCPAQSAGGRRIRIGGPAMSKPSPLLPSSRGSTLGCWPLLFPLSRLSPLLEILLRSTEIALLPIRSERSWSLKATSVTFVPLARSKTMKTNRLLLCQKESPSIFFFFFFLTRGEVLRMGFLLMFWRGKGIVSFSLQKCSHLKKMSKTSRHQKDVWFGGLKEVSIIPTSERGRVPMLWDGGKKQ